MKIVARVEELAEKHNCKMSQIALAWLVHQPLEIFPIVSPSSDKHMKEVIQALELSLTQEECRWLLEG